MIKAGRTIIAGRMTYDNEDECLLHCGNLLIREANYGAGLTKFYY